MSLTRLNPFSDLFCPLHTSDETHEQYRPRKFPFDLTGTQIERPPLVRQKGISEDDIVREFRQMCEADRANQRKDLDG